MRQIILLMILALTASIAQAGVFKCQTPEGLVYSERPCPAGSTSSSIRTIQSADQQQSSQSSSSSQSGISNISAVPLPNPDKQRGAYEAFLAKPNPKAFVICSDGRVVTFAGKDGFVDQKLSELPAGCSVYARNDNVVWSK